MKNQKRFWGVVLMVLGCSAGSTDGSDAVDQALNSASAALATGVGAGGHGAGGAPNSACTGAPIAACSLSWPANLTGTCCTCQGNSGVFRPGASANSYQCVTTCVPCGSMNSCVRYSTSSEYFAGRCCSCSGSGGVEGIRGNLRSTATANVWTCR